jgi:hypothetical protein
MTMEQVPVLSIGAVLGDSDRDSMAWSKAIGDLSREAQALREDVTSPVRLSVVFHVDGRLVPNQFEGVRIGRFDRRNDRLTVQVAVSRSSSEAKREQLVALLFDAIDTAESYAIRKRSTNELLEIRTLASQLAKS